VAVAAVVVGGGLNREIAVSALAAVEDVVHEPELRQEESGDFDSRVVVVDDGADKLVAVVVVGRKRAVVVVQQMKRH
jgi:hypothetical protein